MDSGDANNIYNEGEEGNYDNQGGKYNQNYGYENKGVGDEYYYNNGGYGEEDQDNVVQVDQGTQMSQGIQMNKIKSRDDENAPQKKSLISDKKDFFELDSLPSRNRSNTTYGFHSSFQRRKTCHSC